MARQSKISVAVIRLGALGDLFFTLPMLQTLRHHKSIGRVTVIGYEWVCSLLKNNSRKLADEYIEVEEERNDAGEVTIRTLPDELKQRLAALNCDVVLQCSSLGDDAYARQLATATAAERIIGFSGEADPRLSEVQRKPFWLHEITSHLQLLDFMNPAEYALDSGLDGSFKDRAAAQAILARYDKKCAKKPYIILHAGAGDPRRCWPAEKFAAIAEQLHTSRRTVVLTGALMEMEYSEKVHTLAKVHTCDVSGKIGLDELLCLLANAELVIANDTGPLHAARALGAKTVGLYSARYFMHAAPLFSRRDISLTSQITHCPICQKDVWHKPWPTIRGRGRKLCRHPVSLLQDIRARDVLVAANELLQ